MTTPHSKRYRLTPPSSVYPYTGKPPADPYIPEPSTLSGFASVYPDFEPWTHRRHEDEVAVRNLLKGCVERQIVAKELQLARGWAHRTLKLGSALLLLLSLMHTTLAKRAHMGRVTAKSSFKPPPRVTLTEQKKEIWLRNLANGSVSLRKLSRTIPHGIRNKTLLDQLVAKNVPVDRAIWLIKCIGLNELRLLRRKGEETDGEIAWISEWTRQLIHYIELTLFGPLDSEGVTFEASTRFRILYLKELVRALFMENLVNKRLFLFALVGKLMSKSEEQDRTIPIHRECAQLYILITIFMRELLGFILKNYLLETNLEDEDDGQLFYTTLLRKYIVILVLKYDHIFRRLTADTVVSRPRNEQKNTLSVPEASAGTPLSAHARPGITPISLSGRTPNSGVFATSPYGLTSLGSPVPERPKNGESDSQLVSAVKRVQKTLLVTIKVHLINLFVISLGELFVLPNKNWTSVKHIIEKYNLLNGAPGAPSLTVAPIGSPEDFAASPEKKDTPGSDEEVREERKLEPILGTEDIIKHGISFDVSNDNFVVKNSSRILLKREYDAVSSRNTALFFNMASSFRELQAYERGEAGFKRNEGSSKKIGTFKDVLDELLCLGSKMADFLRNIFEYEFLYVTEKRNEKLAGFGGLSRNVLITSKTSNSLVNIPKKRLASMKGKKLAFGELEIVLTTNEHVRHIDALLNFVFSDFRPLATYFCSEETKAGPPEIVKTRLRVFLACCMLEQGPGRALVAAYIIRCLIAKFKTELYEFASEDASEEDSPGFFEARGVSKKQAVGRFKTFLQSEILDFLFTIGDIDDLIDSEFESVLNETLGSDELWRSDLSDLTRQFILKVLAQEDASENSEVVKKNTNEETETQKDDPASTSSNGISSPQNQKTLDKKKGSSKHTDNVPLKYLNVPSLIEFLGLLIEGKLLALATYIRRLISSGILYIQSLERHALSALHYLILANVGVRVTSSGSIGSVSTQMGFLMRNLKTCILENKTGAPFSAFGTEAGNIMARDLISRLELNKPEMPIEDLALAKQLLKSHVVDSILTSKQVDAPALPSLAFTLRSYVSAWLFREIQTKLREKSGRIGVKTLSTFLTVFSELGHHEHFFAIARALLAANIREDFLMSSPLKISLGYAELHLIISVIWAYRGCINHLPDPMDADVQFENVFSLVLTSVDFDSSTRQPGYMRALDLIKLLVNNYLKLNDLANTFFRGEALDPDLQRLLNGYDFIKYWRFFLSSLEKYEGSEEDVTLNNVKNQLAYLTTEPNMYLIRGEEYVPPLFQETIQPLIGSVDAKDLTDIEQMPTLMDLFLREKRYLALRLLKKIDPYGFDSLLVNYVQNSLPEQHEEALNQLQLFIQCDLLDYRTLLAALVTEADSKPSHLSKGKLTVETGEVSVFPQDLALYLCKFKHKEPALLLFYDILWSSGDEITKVRQAWFETQHAVDSVCATLFMAQNSRFLEEKRPAMSRILAEKLAVIVKMHSDILMECLEKFPQCGPSLVSLFSGMLHPSGLCINRTSDILQLVAFADCENLSICKALVAAALSQADEETMKRTLKCILFSSFAHNLTGRRSASVFIIGELFAFVSRDKRLVLLKESEMLLLQSESFPSIPLLDNAFIPEKKRKYNNFVPYVALLTEKISHGLILEGVPIFIEALTALFSDFLEKVLKVIEDTEGKRTAAEERAISRSVYLLVCILLAHKMPIIYLLGKKSSILGQAFLPSLIQLLKSPLVERHQQIRNRLHDFLYSIRSGLKELARKNGGGKVSISFPKFNHEGQTKKLQQRLLVYLEDDQDLAQVDERPFPEFVLEEEKSGKVHELALRPFDILEDANPVVSLNDTSVNLRWFGARIDRENPA